MATQPVSLTYLGVAGWHVMCGARSLLIDPYFTREPLWKVIAGRARTDTSLVQRYTPPADVLLVSHAHYDHIQDVPEVALLTGAAIYASPQSCQLLHRLGVPETQVSPIQPGSYLDLGSIIVEVYKTPHRHILGSIPLQGALRTNAKPPLRIRDYRMDCQYSFRLTCNGLRILVASGIDEEPAVEADVLLVGPDIRSEQLTGLLQATQPRLVLPNHWDDLFRPLSAPLRTIRYPAIPLWRVSLDKFSTLVRDLHPQTQVLIPERMTPYNLSAYYAGEGQGKNYG